MKTLLITLLVLSNCVLAKSKIFDETKRQINFFENSVIQEFSFRCPKELGEKFDHKQQLKYGLILERKFKAQKKVFLEAEDGLQTIEKTLPEQVRSGELTQTEADSLFTSIQYAKNVILKTRKVEVAEQYQLFKAKLSVIPTIEGVYNKISQTLLPGACEIQNQQMNDAEDEVSFEIKGYSHDGDEIINKYSITKEDLDQGFLSSRFDSGELPGQSEKIITNFNSLTEDSSRLRFSLYENSKGELYYAEFNHDRARKKLRVFGLFEVPYSTVNKKIICSPKQSESEAL